jgi:hypothetical protein
MTSMDSVAVDRFGAFGVNVIGPGRHPFPLSISRAAVSDGWTVNATAARACDLIDVLGLNSGRTAVILNVEHGTWLGDDHRAWPLRRIAEHQHVPATVIDIRWASPYPAFDNDLLVIAWPDLPRLLDGLSPYGMDMFDQPSPPDGIDELVLTVNTSADDDYLIDRLPGATVYYHGHDDCYVHIQTTDPELPSRLFSRLVAMLAGSALLDERTQSVVIPDPDPRLTADLLRRSDHWIGTLAVSRPGNSVTVGLTPRERGWRLGDPIHKEPSHLFTLDADNGAWRASAE